MKEFLMFIITFLIVYLFYFVFVLSRKKILNKFPQSTGGKYLKYKYKININDKNIKSIANMVFIVNSLILSISVVIVSKFSEFIIGILVSIIPIILMTLVFYHFLGIHFSKGGK